MSLTALGIEAIERGLVPEIWTRAAIRQLCRQRLRELARQPAGMPAELDEDGPIAIETRAANEQHYELPPEFFQLVLGPRRKYSCCYFTEWSTRLDQAEDAALAVTCQRAELRDGQRILELGCGWGSLSLWMAECYPNSSIVAVSNSTPQRLFIEAEVRKRGLDNLQVVTADINDFSWRPADFERVVSVEMFEHVRNHRRLFQRIAHWLRPDGKLFVHVFCHRAATYPFETEGAGNWMGRYFFTGGIMPSAQRMTEYPDLFQVEAHNIWLGGQYQRTAEAWLQNLRGHRDRILPILAATYGSQAAPRWYRRWRMFFQAVAETFGFDGGREWFVSHYLLRPTGQQ